MTGSADTPEPTPRPHRRRRLPSVVVRALRAQASRIRRLALTIERGHYRRFLISFIAGFAMLGDFG